MYLSTSVKYSYVRDFRVSAGILFYPIAYIVFLCCFTPLSSPNLVIREMTAQAAKVRLLTDLYNGAGAFNAVKIML